MGAWSDAVTDDEQVSGEVRKEVIDVEGDATTDVRGDRTRTDRG